jgi:hypothetical protein
MVKDKTPHKRLIRRERVKSGSPEIGLSTSYGSTPSSWKSWLGVNLNFLCRWRLAHETKKNDSIELLEQVNTIPTLE